MKRFGEAQKFLGLESRSRTFRYLSHTLNEV